MYNMKSNITKAVKYLFGSTTFLLLLISIFYMCCNCGTVFEEIRYQFDHFYFIISISTKIDWIYGVLNINSVQLRFQTNQLLNPENFKAKGLEWLRRLRSWGMRKHSLLCEAKLQRINIGCSSAEIGVMIPPQGDRSQWSCKNYYECIL